VRPFLDAETRRRGEKRKKERYTFYQMQMDWSRDVVDAGKLLAAYLLAFPVGWYREKEAHTVGLRTFPLVAMASCGYVLLATAGDPSAQSRVIQGLVAGIGFVGGGAILKAEGHVHGTAAAASIWSTGALGAACAEERWVLAIVLSAVNLFALRYLLPIKQRLDGESSPENPAGK
jgi:putative Mg2+ transporter-C (MgtC) family protein